ncbi:MAG TPA: thioredoxin domain-containing protein [bacterium]|nr:thioredoxin domain-containing protein [bacterium]
MKKIAGDDPFLGPENAPVVIVDFSDYFCPHCNELYFETIKKALKEYDGKIKFVARSAVMLSERSYDANKSAFCAMEQGYFWEMHEILLHQLDEMIHLEKTMENFRKLQRLMSKYNNAYLTDLASQIEGLDREKFNKCLIDDPYRNKIIEADQTFRQLGAQGAPFVIINGKAFSGAVPYSFLKKAIDDELKSVAQ